MDLRVTLRAEDDRQIDARRVDGVDEMPRTASWGFRLSLLAIFVLLAIAAQADPPGPRHHPAIGMRYPGAKITAYKETGYDEYRLLVGRVVQRGVPGVTKDLEGEVLPESRPALDEIGKLLRNNPGLAVLVVGNTDNQGPLDYNLGLSARRAEAVVEDLAANYGIERAHERPRGGLPRAHGPEFERGRAAPESPRRTRPPALSRPNAPHQEEVQYSASIETFCQRLATSFRSSPDLIRRWAASRLE
jgi:hypothetical protein